MKRKTILRCIYLIPASLRRAPLLLLTTVFQPISVKIFLQFWAHVARTIVGSLLARHDRGPCGMWTRTPHLHGMPCCVAARNGFSFPQAAFRRVCIPLKPVMKSHSPFRSANGFSITMSNCAIVPLRKKREGEKNKYRYRERKWRE